MLPAPRPLSLSLDAVARQAMGKDWAMYAMLLDRWREIVGEDYAKVTTPVKISFPKGKPQEGRWAEGRRTDGVLHIRLPRGLAMEFSYLTERIRERVADAFGYPAIEKIVLEPAHDRGTAEVKLPPRPLSGGEKAALEDQLSCIKDNELREILRGLGEAVLRKK